MARRINSFPRKPWGYGGGPSYPRGWTYGLMTPERKLVSRAYFPGPWERLALGGNRIPFWHVINYDLASQDSGDDNIVPVHNFTLLAMMGTSSHLQGEPAVPTGFRTQFFQLTDDQGGGCRFSRVGVDSANHIGSAMNPLIIKRPYPMPERMALLNRTINKAVAAGQDTGENVIQIALYGVRDMDHLGP